MMTKFFTTKKWDFHNEQDFSKEISNVEDEIFPTNIKLDLYEFLLGSNLGARQTILKEKLSDLPNNRRNLKM
jgi:hypothetical protein